jgi:ATP-binding cassette, subfamily C (CFTR/MRP), member 4
LSKSGVDFIKLMESFDQDSDESGNEQSEDEASGRSSSKSMSKGSLRGSKASLNKEPKVEEEKKPPQNIDKHLEQTSKGTVQGSIAGNYLKAGTHPVLLFGLFTLFLATQLAASASDWWVAFWTSQEEQRQYSERLLANATNVTDSSTDETYLGNLLSTEVCMWIHGGLVVGLLVLALFRSICFYNTAVRASQKLHDDMFNGIVSTKMRFFDTNPSGRILNRFSKDMGSVDELLPKAILDASQIILMMFGAIIVASIVNYLFLIPVAFLSVIFMYIRKIYLKTSKNIKRLEGVGEY